MGDLGDLRALGRWSARAGSGIVLINPLHAALPRPPLEPSPYFPSSRLFRNPLYLAIEEVARARTDPQIRQMAREARELNAAPLIDRNRIYALKLRALEHLWKRFTGDRDFATYCEREGVMLERYACFCVLSELADAFGRQCVVLAIDARRRDQQWEALVVGGRSAGARDAVGWASEGEGRGAGEILLTSWDADGTRNGHDLELLRAVVSAVHVPVIASGGIGTRTHVVEAFAAGADAVLAASVLHDGDETVGGIKAYAAARGIPVRP